MTSEEKIEVPGGPVGVLKAIKDAGAFKAGETGTEMITDLASHSLDIRSTHPTEFLGPF
ncbi:MAG: hypothetical protein WCL32_21960 [Planctomycetota bacterium]